MIGAKLLLASVCLFATAECFIKHKDIGTAIRCRQRFLVPCDNSKELKFYYNAYKDECADLPQNTCLFGLAIFWKKGFESKEECEKTCVIKKASDPPKDDKPKDDPPKEDKPKEEKPKEDKPKEDKPNEEKPKEDKPKEDKPKEEKPKDK